MPTCCWLAAERAGAKLQVRLALGAARGRLVRQFLTESALLSLAGAALGVLFAQSASQVLVAWISASRNARFLDLSPDLRMLAFTAALTVLTGLLFGLAPALSATRLAPQAALKEGARGLSESHRRMGFGRALVVAQVAFSLVLVAGAGLFVRSLRMLVGQDMGFRRDNILLVDPDLRAAQYSRERQPPSRPVCWSACANSRRGLGGSLRRHSHQQPHLAVGRERGYSRTGNAQGSQLLQPGLTGIFSYHGNAYASRAAISPRPTAPRPRASLS